MTCVQADKNVCPHLYQNRKNVAVRGDLVKIVRFPENPIIRPHMDGRMGRNINGPSLIRVPDWLENPFGRYYLYFAAHKGTYIRLAYADRLKGPWQMYELGVLELADSFFVGHIASPDVHVDDERREIRMYYHGQTPADGQQTRIALSADGLAFAACPEILGTSYFRVFRWDGWWYALVMPGKFMRSRDGLTGFELGPVRFTEDMRHSALTLDGNVLGVFYSNVGDCPESILHCTVELTADWWAWEESESVMVLAPETEYEGADLPFAPSVRGWAPERVRQVRDPAIYREAGRTYLLYSVAGEHGIAIAEVVE